MHSPGHAFQRLRCLMRYHGSRGRALSSSYFVLVFALTAAPLHAQTQTADAQRPLSLEDALSLAEEASEQVAVARAAVMRARGEEYRAWSEWLPQLSGSAAYSRALASEFEGFGGGAPDTTAGPPPAPCERFTPDPTLPLDARVELLEQAVRCADNANPFASLGDLPFGRENTYRLGLSLSQNVFSGGRIAAQNRIANAGRTTAEIALASARAQLVLDVAQAYYDAALSDRLLVIAEATLQQAETTLQLTQLARQVGNQPEFELLRAQVTRDNQRPTVIQRRADRDLTELRLKQLLNLPLDVDLALTTELDDAELVPVANLAAREAGIEVDAAAEARAPVRQAAELVRVREGLLGIARAQRLPALSITSQYGRVAYPESGVPGWDDFRTNWTVGATLQVPIFTGGRIRGDELVAQADLAEARARLQQTAELALLDTRSAYERLQAAEATWEASAGTVGQAARAYQIAELRFREGISTQVELSDARILLQQAEANRAQAARNLQIARVRVALLPDLPLDTSGGAAGAAQQQQQQAPTQQRQPPRQQTAELSPTGILGGGTP
jgi:outer membrane protein TolC